MKNLVIGLGVGLIIGVAGTILFYRPAESPLPETGRPSPVLETGLSPEAQVETLSQASEGGGSDEEFTAAEPGSIPAGLPEEVTGREMEEGTPVEEVKEPAPLSGDRIEELLSLWPDIYTSGNVSDIYALLDELEVEGKKNIDRMISIFRNSDSLTSRLTAARTLGAINRDLKDPELTGILENEVFPFLKKTYREEALPDLRVSCLYTMGEVRTEKSRKFLEEITGDENRKLARAAVFSLGVMGGEKALEKLAGYWTDPKERRFGWTAAAALGDHGDYETLTALRDIYSGTGADDERIMAAYTVGRLNSRLGDRDCESFLLNEVVPFLNDILEAGGDLRTRNWAVSALCETGLREADQALFLILESEEPSSEAVKSTIAAALGNFGGVETSAGLTRLFHYRDGPEKKILAARSLAMMSNRRMDSVPETFIREEVVPFLREAWSEDQPDKLKKGIIKSLGVAGGPEEIDFLESLSAGDRRWRREVQRAIRRIEYREEKGEDWAVTRLKKLRRYP